MLQTPPHPGLWTLVQSKTYILQRCTCWQHVPASLNQVPSATVLPSPLGMPVPPQHLPAQDGSGREVRLAHGILAVCHGGTGGRAVSSSPDEFTVLSPLPKACALIYCNFSVLIKLRDLFKFQSLIRSQAGREITAYRVMN